MIARLIIALSLAAAVMGAYNVTRARKLAYGCASTFGTEAEINAWTCKYCSEYKLINVFPLLSRLKPSIILSLTSLAIPDTPQKMTLSSSPSGALSVYRIGLSTWTPLKYTRILFRCPTQDARDAWFIKASTTPSQE